MVVVLGRPAVHATREGLDRHARWPWWRRQVCWGWCWHGARCSRRCRWCLLLHLFQQLLAKE